MGLVLVLVLVLVVVLVLVLVQAACNVEGEQINKIVDVVQRGLQSKGTYYTTAVSSPPLLACVSIDRLRLCSALLAVKYCYNRV